MRWLHGLVIRYRTRNDLYDDQPDRHPALRQLRVGELLPFKGTQWRIASIREQPIPAVVLVPVGETRASKLHALRKLRRLDKVLTARERDDQAAFRKIAGRRDH